jgi:hypothetical protein
MCHEKGKLSYPPAMSALHAGSSRAPGWRTWRRCERCAQHKVDGEADIVTAQNEIVAGKHINMASTP